MSLTPDSGALKRAVAAKALDYVLDGMKLGLGTGTTAEEFLELLGPRVRSGLAITGVATSERTAVKARSLGIPIAELDTLAPLDLTIDGADQVDHSLNLIKGGGGALLREKIVATSSKQMLVIVDETKLVTKLGAFSLPVEVIAYGHLTTQARIQAALTQLGYVRPGVTLREKNGAAFVTDSGNVIYDCALGLIGDAPKLAHALDAITGAVEHGLFIGIATRLLVARPGGVDIIDSQPR